MGWLSPKLAEAAGWTVVGFFDDELREGQRVGRWKMLDHSRSGSQPGSASSSASAITPREVGFFVAWCGTVAGSTRSSTPRPGSARPR